MDNVETVVRILNRYIVYGCQLLAMIVISIGVVKAMLTYVQAAVGMAGGQAALKESRAELGHSFSLGLGFLIGASILHTTLAPTWNDIGKLAAIIAIRTILNFFLLREISFFSKSAAKANGEAEKETDASRGADGNSESRTERHADSERPADTHSRANR